MSTTVRGEIARVSGRKCVLEGDAPGLLLRPQIQKIQTRSRWVNRRKNAVTFDKAQDVIGGVQKSRRNRLIIHSPYHDGMFRCPGRYQATVRGDRDRGHASASHDGSRKRVGFLGRCAPEHQGLVLASRGYRAAVRGNGQSPDFMTMATEVGAFAKSNWVPQAHRLI